MKTIEINSLVLAYLGDSIYESYVREYLISLGTFHVKELQEKSLEYVSARSQSKILNDLIDKNIFTKEELEIIKRGRNQKSHTSPKNADIIDYKCATGFEALVGYLYLSEEKERLEYIIYKGISIIENNM